MKKIVVVVVLILVSFPFVVPVMLNDSSYYVVQQEGITVSVSNWFGGVEFDVAFPYEHAMQARRERDKVDQAFPDEPRAQDAGYSIDDVLGLPTANLLQTAAGVGEVQQSRSARSGTEDFSPEHLRRLDEIRIVGTAPDGDTIAVTAYAATRSRTFERRGEQRTCAVAWGVDGGVMRVTLDGEPIAAKSGS